MQPLPPSPYGYRRYPLPAVSLRCARLIETPDGAKLATFVYDSTERPLPEALAADPVLVLHGNGGSHATFVSVIERLCAAGLPVIALDSRAHGQSSRGSAKLTYERMTEDALFVLDALGVAAVHVLGHSDGGIEALLLARDHADRILSIVAGGANLTPAGVVDEWDMEGSVEANRAFAAWLASGDVPDEVDTRLLPSPQELTLASELFLLMLTEPQIEASSLAAIRCPTCVLVGEHDCITREETEAIAKGIEGARLVTVPGADHSLPRKAPDAVALQVLTNVLLSHARK